MKDVTQNPASSQPPELLDQLRLCIRNNQDNFRTGRAFDYWARWYICFPGVRYPIDMGAPGIQVLMSCLVNEQGGRRHLYSGAVRVALPLQEAAEDWTSVD